MVKIIPFNLQFEMLFAFRTIRVCTVPLSSVSFNRDGDAVALASQTGTVYLFDATRDGYAYKKSGKVNCGHNLQSLDWSEDGDHIQVKSKRYALVDCLCEFHLLSILCLKT